MPVSKWKTEVIFSQNVEGNPLPHPRSDVYRVRRKEIKKAFRAPCGEFAQDVMSAEGKERVKKEE